MLMLGILMAMNTALANEMPPRVEPGCGARYYECSAQIWAPPGLLIESESERVLGQPTSLRAAWSYVSSLRFPQSNADDILALPVEFQTLRFAIQRNHGTGEPEGVHMQVSWGGEQGIPLNAVSTLADGSSIRMSVRIRDLNVYIGCAATAEPPVCSR
jgi:hypothetical protein